jgi:hypothetical protein
MRAKRNMFTIAGTADRFASDDKSRVVSVSRGEMRNWRPLETT